MIYDHINEITVEKAEIIHNHYFTHIKTFEFKCAIPLKMIISVIDLYPIKRLTVLSFDDLLMFMPLNYVMSKLSELVIVNIVTHDMIERIDH